MTVNATFNATAPRPNAAITGNVVVTLHVGATAPRPRCAIVLINSRPAPPARPSVPLDSSNDRQHRQQIATAVNGIRKGQIDCTTQVTLAASADTTTLTDARISSWSHISLSPMTADAAAEMTSGNLYWTTSNGNATLYHTNSAVADRTFSVAILG